MRVSLASLDQEVVSQSINSSNNNNNNKAMMSSSTTAQDQRKQQQRKQSLKKMEVPRGSMSGSLRWNSIRKSSNAGSGAITAPTPTRVAIVGTGDCALGLACYFRNHNDLSTKNTLVVTKPKIQLEKYEVTYFHDTGVPLASFDDSIKSADVIVLAIPAVALRIFVPEHYSRIKEKILVDATNSSRKGEDLRELLGVTDVRWVKAFNDIGAIDGMTSKVTTKHKVPAKMCSSNPHALRVVKDFAESSLGFDVKIVPYERYDEIAMNQDSLGKEWLIAGFYMGISLVLFQIYNILRHHVSKGYPWYSFPLFVTNKALAWTVLHGMTTAQIPGILAHFHTMWYKDSLIPKPYWLRVCLSVRKHIGLLSLWMLLMHIIGSCIFFNQAYLKKFFVEPKAYSSKLNWMGELSFACGVWGTGLYTIMGVASMPNIAAEMTSKQWWFIFGPIAWIALVLGTVHTMVQGVENWDNKAKWYGGYPQMTLTSTILPMFVFTLKGIQVFLWLVGCGNKKPEQPGPVQYTDITETFKAQDDSTPNGSGVDGSFGEEEEIVPTPAVATPPTLPTTPTPAPGAGVRRSSSSRRRSSAKKSTTTTNGKTSPTLAAAAAAATAPAQQQVQQPTEPEVGEKKDWWLSNDVGASSPPDTTKATRRSSSSRRRSSARKSTSNATITTTPATSKQEPQAPTQTIVGGGQEQGEQNENSAPPFGEKKKAMAAELLPPGWSEVKDPSSGDSYYWNEATGETSWDRP